VTLDEEAGAELEELLQYLKQRRGFDFTGYKRASLARRIRRRMAEVGAESFADYQDKLETEGGEFTKLFNTILINVTDFFRDRESWEFLRAEVIPRLVESKSSSEPIRVWSAGGAAGQEACTMAMLLAEELGAERFRDRVKIYATDVDEDALEEGRRACYRTDRVESVPEELRNKYFEADNGSYTLSRELRRAIVFGRHNLIQDAPISRIDLLTCRNTLIYFNAETQLRILSRFHSALEESGFLFLGTAEMLLTHGHLFSPVNLRQRVFARVPEVARRERMIAVNRASRQDSDSGDESRILDEHPSPASKEIG